MKLIRRQRNGYALLFAASICLAAWFGATFMLEAAFAFGVISTASLIFLVRQSRLLYDAILIRDNIILAVASAYVSTADANGRNDTEETVVSTFGILIGSKIYRWGRDGLSGMRLNAVEFDREQMRLSFGDAAHTMHLELLHGITEQQILLDVKHKLWRETGVQASIHGW